MHLKYLPIFLLAIVMLKGESTMDNELSTVKVDRLKTLLPQIL